MRTTNHSGKPAKNNGNPRNTTSQVSTWRSNRPPARSAIQEKITPIPPQQTHHDDNLVALKNTMMNVAYLFLFGAESTEKYLGRNTSQLVDSLKAYDILLSRLLKYFYDLPFESIYTKREDCTLTDENFINDICKIFLSQQIKERAYLQETKSDPNNNTDESDYEIKVASQIISRSLAHYYFQLSLSKIDFSEKNRRCYSDKLAQEDALAALSEAILVMQKAVDHIKAAAYKMQLICDIFTENDYFLHHQDKMIFCQNMRIKMIIQQICMNDKLLQMQHVEKQYTKMQNAQENIFSLLRNRRKFNFNQNQKEQLQENNTFIKLYLDSPNGNETFDKIEQESVKELNDLTQGNARLSPQSPYVSAWLQEYIPILENLRAIHEVEKEISQQNDIDEKIRLLTKIEKALEELWDKNKLIQNASGHIHALVNFRENRLLVENNIFSPQSNEQANFSLVELLACIRMLIAKQKEMCLLLAGENKNDTKKSKSSTKLILPEQTTTNHLTEFTRVLLDFSPSSLHVDGHSSTTEPGRKQLASAEEKVKKIQESLENIAQLRKRKEKINTILSAKNSLKIEIEKLLFDDEDADTIFHLFIKIKQLPTLILEANDINEKIIDAIAFVLREIKKQLKTSSDTPIKQNKIEAGHALFWAAMLWPAFVKEQQKTNNFKQSVTSVFKNQNILMEISSSTTKLIEILWFDYIKQQQQQKKTSTLAMSREISEFRLFTRNEDELAICHKTFSDFVNQAACLSKSLSSSQTRAPIDNKPSLPSQATHAFSYPQQRQEIALESFFIGEAVKSYDNIVLLFPALSSALVKTNISSTIKKLLEHMDQSFILDNQSFQLNSPSFGKMLRNETYQEASILADDRRPLMLSRNCKRKCRISLPFFLAIILFPLLQLQLNKLTPNTNTDLNKFIRSFIDCQLMNSNTSERNKEYIAALYRNYLSKQGLIIPSQIMKIFIVAENENSDFHSWLEQYNMRNNAVNPSQIYSPSRRGYNGS